LPPLQLSVAEAVPPLKATASTVTPASSAARMPNFAVLCLPIRDIDPPWIDLRFFFSHLFADSARIVSVATELGVKDPVTVGERDETGSLQRTEKSVLQSLVLNLFTLPP
jgi:hypothetical protein